MKSRRTGRSRDAEPAPRYPSRWIKEDALGGPMFDDDRVSMLGLASSRKLVWMNGSDPRVNPVLRTHLRSRGRRVGSS